MVNSNDAILLIHCRTIYDDCCCYLHCSIYYFDWQIWKMATKSQHRTSFKFRFTHIKSHDTHANVHTTHRHVCPRENYKFYWILQTRTRINLVKKKKKKNGSRNHSTEITRTHNGTHSLNVERNWKIGDVMCNRIQIALCFERNGTERNETKRVRTPWKHD